MEERLKLNDYLIKKIFDNIPYRLVSKNTFLICIQSGKFSFEFFKIMEIFTKIFEIINNRPYQSETNRSLYDELFKELEIYFKNFNKNNFSEKNEIKEKIFQILDLAKNKCSPILNYKYGKEINSNSDLENILEKIHNICFIDNYLIFK